MTNVEKLAVLNACFGINYCEYSVDGLSMSAKAHRQVDALGDQCTICGWLGLNPFNDREFIQRAHEIDPTLQMTTLLKMDAQTALQAYAYMYKTCNLHGAPSAKKIEMFDLFGGVHRITYAQFKQAIERR